MINQEEETVGECIARFLQIIRTEESYRTDSLKKELLDLNEKCKAAGGGCLFEGFGIKIPQVKKSKPTVS